MQHQEEASEEEIFQPRVTNLQKEHSESSPALRSTLEHIVQQLDILTQVSSAERFTEKVLFSKVCNSEYVKALSDRAKMTNF